MKPYDRYQLLISYLHPLSFFSVETENFLKLV